jgi:hypothetical protein
MSVIQEIQIYGQWCMAVLHKEAVIIIHSYKCPETGFKLLAAVALAAIF